MMYYYYYLPEKINDMERYTDPIKIYIYNVIQLQYKDSIMLTTEGQSYFVSFIETFFWLTLNQTFDTSQLPIS
jgi:hypothetical protein